jgi:hypothetical protein
MTHEPLPQLDLLLAATLYLMTRYHAQRCPCVASAVVQHLDLLSRHGHERPSAMLRSVCAQLELDWRALMAQPAPPPRRH